MFLSRSLTKGSLMEIGEAFGHLQLLGRRKAARGNDGLERPGGRLQVSGSAGLLRTAALRDGDWLSVRDMGRLDEQGGLHLMGRQNRMIVTQGKNLFPEELETVLASHPAVAAASAHGLPHPVRGQQVVAVVQRRPGVALTAAELSAWCSARLEAFKRPRAWYVAEPWPQTASGKTDHPALAQALAQQPLPPWLRPLP